MTKTKAFFIFLFSAVLGTAVGIAQPTPGPTFPNLDVIGDITVGGDVDGENVSGLGTRVTTLETNNTNTNTGDETAATESVAGVVELAAANEAVGGMCVQGNDPRIAEFTTTQDGLVPQSGASTALFLRGDGAWADPSLGSGHGTSNSIDDHADVDIVTDPVAEGEVLIWRTNEFVPEPAVAAEVNDLTSAVTWANIPAANVPQLAVTQHEAALSILDSQVSGLGSAAGVNTGTALGTVPLHTADGQLTLDDGVDSAIVSATSFAPGSSGYTFGDADHGASPGDVVYSGAGSSSASTKGGETFIRGGGASGATSEGGDVDIYGGLGTGNNGEVLIGGYDISPGNDTLVSASVAEEIRFAKGFSVAQTAAAPAALRVNYGRYWVRQSDKKPMFTDGNGVSYDLSSGGAEVNDLSSVVTWANIPAANVPELAITQHEAAVDHDALLGFVLAEHVDWSLASQGTIHATNFTAGTGDVISSESTGTTLDGELVVFDDANGKLVRRSTTMTEAVLGTMSSDIAANNVKVTYDDAAAVALNTAKISYTDAAAVALNTAKISYTDAAAVGLNSTHRGSDGTDHANVVTNTSNIAALGSASARDIGIAIGDVVGVVDVGGAVAGLPALDGSQLTGVTSAPTAHGLAGAEHTSTSFALFDDKISDHDMLADAAKLALIEALATADQTAGEIEAIVSHDLLLDFLADEHVVMRFGAGLGGLGDPATQANTYYHDTTANKIYWSSGSQWLTHTHALTDLDDQTQATILGRAAAAGTGAPVALSGTDATAILDLFSTSTTTQGLVPGSSGAGVPFTLRADGTWKQVAIGELEAGAKTQLDALSEAFLISDKADEFSQLTDGEKATTLVAADRILIEDSADTLKKKWATVDKIPSGGGGYGTAGVGSWKHSGTATFTPGSGLFSCGTTQTKASMTSLAFSNTPFAGVGNAWTFNLLSDKSVRIGDMVYIQSATDPLGDTALFEVAAAPTVSTYVFLGTLTYRGHTGGASFAADTEYLIQIIRASNDINGVVENFASRTDAGTDTYTKLDATHVDGLPYGLYEVTFNGTVYHTVSGALISLQMNTSLDATVAEPTVVTSYLGVIEQRANGGSGKQNVSWTWHVTVDAANPDFFIRWKNDTGTVAFCTDTQLHYRQIQ